MRQRAILTLIAVLGVLAVAIPSTPAAGRPAGNDRLQELAVKKINALRARHGVRPLRAAKGLRRSATNYARYMLSTGYFGHLSIVRGPRRYRSLGELILLHRGTHGRPRTAVRYWALSPPHRYVMLSPKYGRVGIGKVSGRFRGRKRTVWVAHVGRR